MVEKNTLPGWWTDFFEPMSRAGERLADWFSPRSDAASAENAYEINVELPGVREDDIEVELQDGVLSVRGEKKSETTEEKAGYYFSERQYGRFQRTFRLPADASEEGIEARFDDGVLKITVPKSTPPAQAAKKISVRKG